MTMTCLYVHVGHSKRRSNIAVHDYTVATYTAKIQTRTKSRAVAIRIIPTLRHIAIYRTAQLNTILVESEYRIKLLAQISR